MSHGEQFGLLGVGRSVSFGDGVNALALDNADIEQLKLDQATYEQVQERFGKPRATYTSRAVKWLRYSHSPTSSNYRLRMIAIDDDGNVCFKRSEIYWD